MNMSISKITSSIILDHRRRADREGRMQLEIRITWQRTSHYLQTGIKVRPQEWAAGRIVNCLGSRELNERLAIIFSRTMAIVNDYLREGRALDFETIRQEVWRLMEELGDEKTMVEWMEEQVGMLNVSKGTRMHYYTLIERLKEYGGMTTWKQVNAEAVYKWDAWLHQLPARQGGRISDASVHNYHKNLKALLKRASAFGKIVQNPYDNLRGKFPKGEKENIDYLTEEEMMRIQELDIPEGTQLAAARDLFVFQMYTGLAYSDSQTFDISKYKFDGERWIRTGERIKTGVPYVSSLLPPVVSVLERYGMRTPQIDNADYNHLLKAVGVMAGISVRMHSHLARHTFATYMLRNGVQIQNLSRMLGHNNIQQTMRYAKVLALDVHGDFDMIARKMKKG